MTPPLTITIRRRSDRGTIFGRPWGDDWHASIADRPGLWDCGRSRAEALGNLVRSHPEEFGVVIDDVDVTASPKGAMP